VLIKAIEVVQSFTLFPRSSTMQVKQIFAISALALAASASMAAGPANNDAPLTRAQVERSVIAARAAGELTPAGEAEYPLTPMEAKSTLSRSEVKGETLQARATGELRDAGEAVDEPDNYQQTPSTVSRADVKAATIRARNAGQLIPAGEDVDERVQPRRVS
jgi:hypothetical protein